MAFSRARPLLSFDEDAEGPALQLLLDPAQLLAVAPPPTAAAADSRAELRAYVERLAGTAQGAPALPPDFPALVQREVQQLLAGAARAERGWLATATSAPPVPAPAPAAKSAAAAPQDPKLREALKQVRQLDGALEAASKRAAAVAAAAAKTAVVLPADDGRAQGEPDCTDAGESGGALAAAIRRERRRLQQAGRLSVALQEGDAEPGRAGAAVAAGAPVLSPQQERLVEALLVQTDAEALAAAGPFDAFDAFAGELSVIEAQLAALRQCGGDSCGDGQALDGQAAACTGSGAATPPALDLLNGSSGSEEGGEEGVELAASRAAFVRRVGLA